MIRQHRISGDAQRTHCMQKKTRMAPYKALSQRLTEALSLTVPPVAVSFHRKKEPSEAAPDTPVPAGCKFWEIGSARAVTTGSKDHCFCSVGIYTHNMDGALESQSVELEETLAAMRGLDYVRPVEIESLPVLARSPRYVKYAPLGDSTDPPELVLIFANASQGLVLSEAVTRVDGVAPPAMGRPACALIPRVIDSGLSATSLGCCGARAYLDVLGDEIALWGLAGDKLALYVDSLEVLSKANSVLGRFHRQRRVEIEAGASPTVKESLSRL